MQSRANDRFLTITLPHDPAGVEATFVMEPVGIPSPVFGLDNGAVKPGIAGTRIPFQLTQPFGTLELEFGEFEGEINADAAGPRAGSGKGTVRPGMLGSIRPP